jgi:hypothetical protein
MSDISTQENKLIDTVKALKTTDEKPVFLDVESMGRKGKPVAFRFPAAFVCYLSDQKIPSKPRPMFKRRFTVVIVNQNVSNEKNAATDTYELIESARDAILGKTLGLSGVSPFELLGITIDEFDAGKITYTLFFETTVYLPIPR